MAYGWRSLELELRLYVYTSFPLHNQLKYGEMGTYYYIILIHYPWASSKSLYGASIQRFWSLVGIK